MGVIERILQAADIVLLGLSFALLYGGHWTPWTMIPSATNEEGKLRPVLSYIYGVTCILLVFIAWTWFRWLAGIATVDIWQPVKFLVLDCVAAGLGTICPRLFRLIKEFGAMLKDREIEKKARHGSPDL